MYFQLSWTLQSILVELSSVVVSTVSILPWISSSLIFFSTFTVTVWRAPIIIGDSVDFIFRNFCFSNFTFSFILTVFCKNGEVHELRSYLLLFLYLLHFLHQHHHHHHHIIIIIIYSLKFFTSALADGLSLEFE